MKTTQWIRFWSIQFLPFVSIAGLGCRDQSNPNAQQQAEEDDWPAPPKLVPYNSESPLPKPVVDFENS